MLNNKKSKKEKNEDEKTIAEKLNEAIRKTEEEKKAKEKPEEDIFKELDSLQLTPQEQLSTNIAVHLADVTAKRFMQIACETDFASVMQLVRRFETSDSRTVIDMLQAMFLSNGYMHAAEELDILGECESFDCDVFDTFVDEFLDNECVDVYTVEVWLVEGVPEED